MKHLLIIFAFTFPLIELPRPLHANSAGGWSIDNGGLGCTQPVAEQAATIRDAETNHFTIRRLEFVGNEHTSDGVLRKRMSALKEGEKFRRSNLKRSLANVSRLKIIYPVHFRDVVLRLEKSEKVVDVVICFNERKVAKK
jgi:hypothetical protein